jgi:peptidyl-prolyl cis-trans isomerase D
MIQNIHDKAQGLFAWIIVLLIAIPFALWGVHEYFNPVPKIVVAEVNGKELLDNEFRYNVQQQRNQLRAMFKQDVDLSFMEKQIKERTLNRMIDEEVLVQTALTAGLRIGDVLLASRIKQYPAFLQNGVFSPDAYQRFLRTQGMKHTDFEMQIRRALLTDQLREGVLRSTLLTSHDLQTRTRLEEQQRAVSFLIVPTTRFKDAVTNTDAEIEAYYNEHKNTADYMIPEKVSVEYVELLGKDLVGNQTVDEDTLKKAYEDRLASFTTPVEWHARHILVAVDLNAPADKVEAAKKKAQDLLAKIKAGGAFEELAKQSSDDPSAKQGGDLKWFGPGAMVKPFEDALKNLKKDEVSEPVKSQFGFHLIKLLDTKPEKVRSFAEVREQLQQETLKEQAEKAFSEQADQFANLAYEHSNSLEVLATTLKLKVKTTELFDHQTAGSKDSILATRQVIDAAFSDTVSKERLNSQVIEIGEQHEIVLRIKDHQEAVAKPLTEVKDKVVTALSQAKTKEKAHALGKTLLDQIKQQGDPEATAKSANLTWEPAKWISRQETTIKQLAIVQEAFKMGVPADKKAVYQGIGLPNGDYAVIAVLAVKDGEEKPATTAAKDNKTPDPKQQERLQQQRALGESEFQELVEQLKSEAKIKTYPENLSKS